MSINRQLEGVPYERIALPWPLQKAFMETFPRDVRHYFFNVEFPPVPASSTKFRASYGAPS